MPWFGPGFGWGRGWGWRWCWLFGGPGRGWGWRWWWRVNYPYYWEISPEAEKSMLETEAAFLKGRLQAIERRLSQLEKAQA